MDWLEFHPLWIGAGAGALLAIVSFTAERMRQKRRNIDRVGFVPWNALGMLGVGLTLVGAALAIKAGL